MDETPEVRPPSRSPLLLGGALLIAALIVGAALFLSPAAPEPLPEARPAGPAPPSTAPAAKRSPVSVPTAPAALPVPEARTRPAGDAARAESDRVLEAGRRESERLASAGDAPGALAALRALPDPRAQAEAMAFENRLRARFNETAAAAAELATAGKFTEAIALFDARSKGTLPEITDRCAEAAGRLRKAAVDRDAHQAALGAESCRVAFRKETGPKLLTALRARAWPEALALLDGAAKNPDWNGLRADLAAERAALELGARFREAFLKELQGRVNLDGSFLITGGKRVHGRITAVEADRAVLQIGETTVTVPLDQFAADQVLVWTVGRTLPPEDGATWLKAAMFFFGDGRDDLAALYLATAREKGAEIDAVEKVWREGLVRSLSAK